MLKPEKKEAQSSRIRVSCQIISQYDNKEEYSPKEVAAWSIRSLSLLSNTNSEVSQRIDLFGPSITERFSVVSGPPKQTVIPRLNQRFMFYDKNVN